jgi:hypothetical protein
MQKKLERVCMLEMALKLVVQVNSLTYTTDRFHPTRLKLYNVPPAKLRKPDKQTVPLKA